MDRNCMYTATVSLKLTVAVACLVSSHNKRDTCIRGRSAIDLVTLSVWGVHTLESTATAHEAHKEAVVRLSLLSCILCYAAKSEPKR